MKKHLKQTDRKKRSALNVENFCAVCECVIPHHDPRITVWVCSKCMDDRSKEVAEIISTLERKDEFGED